MGKNFHWRGDYVPRNSKPKPISSWGKDQIDSVTAHEILNSGFVYAPYQPLYTTQIMTEFVSEDIDKLNCGQIKRRAIEQGLFYRKKIRRRVVNIPINIAYSENM